MDLKPPRPLADNRVPGNDNTGYTQGQGNTPTPAAIGNRNPGIRLFVDTGLPTAHIVHDSTIKR